MGEQSRPEYLDFWQIALQTDQEVSAHCFATAVDVNSSRASLFQFGPRETDKQRAWHKEAAARARVYLKAVETGNLVTFGFSLSPRVNKCILLIFKIWERQASAFPRTL